ncbi:MAG: hypothetical protein N2440_01815 [Actinobacteria bacterium]|nr:hypothetical protein [Actinomycetota bacterium]
MKKILLLVLDGAADRRTTALKGQTPLEFARTPSLDKIASASIAGWFYPREDFLGASTDLTHFMMLGYSPEEYPGRSILEAMALGLEVKKQVLYLSVLIAASKSKENELYVKREEISFKEKETIELFNAVSYYCTGFYEFRLHHQKGRYGILEINGPFGEGPLDTDPFKDNYPIINPYSSGLGFRDGLLADALKKYLRWAFEKLAKHPVNRERVDRGEFPLDILVTKWPSFIRTAPTPFADLTKMKGAIIAEQSFFNGLSILLGLKFIKNDKKDPESKTRFAIKKAENLLFSEDFDFVLVNIKDADEASHTKNPLKKAEVIEMIDKGLSEIFQTKILDTDHCVFCVVSDHPTPSEGNLIHSGEPTPLIIHSFNFGSDECKRFTEAETARGNLSKLHSSQLMPVLLNAADRIAYSGSRTSVFKSIGFPAPDQIQKINLREV